MKDDKIFIPLSIDRVQASKQLYFMTNGKMAGLGGIIIIYFVLAAILLRGSTSVIPLIILTVMFLILAVYYIRFVMFEEKRLKKSVKDSDDNRIVKLDHFNAIQMVDKNGLIRYQYRTGLRRAFVVYIRRGSKVGVPDGFMEQQAKVLNAFLQEIHRKGWSYDRYEMERSPQLAPSTIQGLNKIRSIKDTTRRNYHRLQMETMKEYTMSDSQEVVDYYVIYNPLPITYKHFEDNLRSIIRRTLKTSSYFNNSKILNLDEVEKFISEVVLIDTFDIRDVRRNVEVKPFREFGAVVRAFDTDGEEELMVKFEESVLDAKTYDESIYDTVERKERIAKDKFNQRVKEYERKLERIIKEKERDRITFGVFVEKRNELFEKSFDRNDLKMMEDESLIKVYYEVYGNNTEKDNVLDEFDEEIDLGLGVEKEEVKRFGVPLETDAEDDELVIIDDLEDDNDDEDDFFVVDNHRR